VADSNEGAGGANGEGNSNSLLGGAGGNSGGASGDSNSGVQDAPLLDAAGQPVVKDGKPVLLEAGQKQEVKDGKPVYDAEGKPVFAKAESKSEGAPENYEAFKLPEGVTMDETATKTFSDLAKKNNMNQNAAQEFIDLHVGMVKNWVDNLQAQQVAERQKWVTSSREDKEFGGPKLDENLGAAKAALTKFGTPAFLDFVDKSGLGDHPEFIRFALHVANATKEDALPDGRGGSQHGTSDTGVFNYGASKHN